MRNIFFIVLGALNFGWPAILFAQSTSEAATKTEGAKPIIVTGQKLDRAAVKKETLAFVRELGLVTTQRQVARWTAPICPKVIGLAPDHAAIVDAKIRAVAKMAGATVAPSSCKTNVVISFTVDADDLVRRLKKANGRLLSQVEIPDRDKLTEGDAPIRWWYSTDDKSSESGSAMSTATAPWTAGNSEGGGSVVPTNADMKSNNMQNASLIRTSTMRVLRSAMVVVDVNRAAGTTLDAVAAYAAFVALAEIDGDAQPQGSILSLFGEERAADDLTARDAALLKAIYDIQLDRNALLQRNKLVGEIVDAQLQE